MPTHLNQRPADHVMLELVAGDDEGCQPGGLDFVRVLPDGSSTGPFRVPAGKFLIITDIDWQYEHGTASGQMQILRLFIENLADPAQRRRAWESTILLNSNGQGGTSEAMTAGIVVSAKARICPDVFPGPIGPPYGLLHLMLRGYLIGETRGRSNERTNVRS